MLYPLFLRLQCKKCLIFGGGAVAFRKAKILLKAGAKVTVVSLDFVEGLRKMARKNKRLCLDVIPRSGATRDLKLNARFLACARNDSLLKGIALAFACTSSHEENLRFTKACQKKGIWVNQADDLEKSDFLVPAGLNQGPLQIAISTSGLSPFLARNLKQRMKAVLKKEDALFLSWMRNRRVRSRVIEALSTPSERRSFFQTLAAPGFLQLFRSPKIARIEKVFERQLTNFQKKGT